MEQPQQILVTINSDGLRHRRVGEIIGRFESNGFTVTALQLFTVGHPLAEGNNAGLPAFPFGNGLAEYINFGPVLVMTLEGGTIGSDAEDTSMRDATDDEEGPESDATDDEAENDEGGDDDKDNE